jgi:hypothetical protein
MGRFRRELDDLILHRHAYLLAASAALGSIFYGWDIGAWEHNSVVESPEQIQPQRSHRRCSRYA